MTYVVLDGGKLICTKLYEREIYIADIRFTQ